MSYFNDRGRASTIVYGPTIVDDRHFLLICDFSEKSVKFKKRQSRPIRASTIVENG